MKTEKLTYKEASQALIDGLCVMNPRNNTYKLAEGGRITHYTGSFDNWSETCSGLGDGNSFSIVPDPSIKVEVEDEVAAAIEEVQPWYNIGSTATVISGLYKVVTLLNDKINKLRDDFDKHY